MKKDAYYFSHDSNARNDDKILELRSKFGYEGYGIFWAIIEVLRDQTNYSYETEKINGLSIAINVDKVLLSEILNYCIKISLFVENNGFFYSESLMVRISKIDESRLKRAEAGRKGGIAKALLQQSSGNGLANSSKEKKGKESKKEENIKIYSTENFEERFDIFKKSVLTYLNQYDKTLLKSFFEYWSEKNQKGYKMRFEMEKTWDLQKRIKRWSDNNFNSKKQTGGYSLAEL